MNSTQPLISVIIPVYNTAPYLRKCLDSVCCQTYRNLEIICVNDGSTDASADILAEYAARDSRIVVLTQENAGQAAARNAALKLATGTWITGVDSDDYIEPDTYEYCIRNVADDAVKLIVYRFDIRDGDSGSRIVCPRQQAAGMTDVSPGVLFDTVCYFVNKLWHRDILSMPGASFPEGMWFEDVVFFYKIAPYLERILYLPQVKYHYLRYKGYPTTMDKARALPNKNCERVRAVELAFGHYAQHPLPEAVRNLRPGLLLHFYNELRAYLTPETEQPAWDMLRRIVAEHGLLPTLCDEPELALCYYMPPCALTAHSRHFASMQEFELLLISGRLRKQYCLLLMQMLFSWGNKRARIQAQMQQYKHKLRWLRFRKRQCWKLFQRSAFNDVNSRRQRAI